MICSRFRSSGEHQRSPVVNVDAVRTGGTGRVTPDLGLALAFGVDQPQEAGVVVRGRVTDRRIRSFIGLVFPDSSV